MKHHFDKLNNLAGEIRLCQEPVCIGLICDASCRTIVAGGQQDTHLCKMTAYPRGYSKPFWPGITTSLNTRSILMPLRSIVCASSALAASTTMYPQSLRCST